VSDPATGGTAPIGALPPDPDLARRPVLLACLATALVPFASTSVAVALPGIRRSFALSVGTAVLLVTGYLVVTAAVQPVVGVLGDRWGRRRALGIGIAGFGLASGLAAAAPVFPALVAARCVQAVAGSLALVNAAALVRTSVPARSRGRAYGLLGTVATGSAAAGPPVGGAAAALLGWRGVFLAVLPLVVAAGTASGAATPRPGSSTARPAPPGAGGRLDVLGAALLLASLAAFSGVLTAASESAGAGVLAVAGGILALAVPAFVAVERRARAPVLDLTVLRIPAVRAAGTAVAAANFTVYTMLLAIPLLLARRADVRGEAADGSSLHAGLLVMPLLVGTAVAALIGGLVADRLGRRIPAVAGHVLLGLACAGLVRSGLDGGTSGTVALLAAAGVGQGLAAPSVQAAGAEALPPERSGLASGVWSLGRYLGSITGAGLLALVTSGTGHGVFVAATVAAAVAVLAAVALPSGRDPADGVHQAERPRQDEPSPDPGAGPRKGSRLPAV
jgi:DHA2 family methylenomycin A resistance protein-like MFS transporter